MKKKDRIVHRYYHGDEMVFELGYASYIKAQPPLKMHNHGGCMEFVYVVKGKQIYQVNGIDYPVENSNVFFTHPYEDHTTGSYPEEVSVIYYFIIDLEILPDIGIFVKDEEYADFREQWKNYTNHTFKASQELLGAMRHLISCFDKKDIHFDSRVRNALSEVLMALSCTQHIGSRQTSEKIENSLNYINAHLDESIRVSVLADMDYMSLSAYNKVFAQIMGMSPGEYILKQKIEKAKEMLTETELAVTDIAYKLGFSSSQYFATVFKRFCCETPKVYRSRSKCKKNIT